MGSRGPSAFSAITLAFGWLVEFLGTTTQFPFGEYEYTSALGVSVLSVPILIPMAWSMVAYPMLLAVQRLSTTSLGVAIIGGWLLMSWDLFLDPQMVGEGYWTWTTIGWQLPGIPGIPLQNFLGWWLAGMLLMFLLDRLPRKTANDSAPNTLLLWTYASNVLGAAVFFDRPSGRDLGRRRDGNRDHSVGVASVEPARMVRRLLPVLAVGADRTHRPRSVEQASPSAPDTGRCGHHRVDRCAHPRPE